MLSSDAANASKNLDLNNVKSNIGKSHRVCKAELPSISMFIHFI